MSDTSGIQIKLELADTSEIEAALDRVAEKMKAVALSARDAKDALDALSTGGRFLTLTGGGVGSAFTKGDDTNG